MNRTRLLLPGILLVLLSLPAAGADFELKMDRLADALKPLTGADRTSVDEAVTLIRKGENSLALARLSQLNAANPRNSSLRILTSYALLQVGNLLGAFEEARTAESAPGGNAYKCWFLAKVAWVSGNASLCERELKHLKGAKEMVAEVRSLEAEMKAKQPAAR